MICSSCREEIRKAQAELLAVVAWNFTLGGYSDKHDEINAGINKIFSELLGKGDAPSVSSAKPTERKDKRVQDEFGTTKTRNSGKTITNSCSPPKKVSEKKHDMIDLTALAEDGNVSYFKLEIMKPKKAGK